MSCWFKRKQKFSHRSRGISDNFDTPPPTQVQPHQENGASSVVSRDLTNTYGYDCADRSYSSDQPAIAYPYQSDQGLGNHQPKNSFKVNAGSNLNRSGTQKNGGIMIVTSSGSGPMSKYKEVDFDVGHNLNEGDHQVNDNVYYNDVGEANQRC